MKREELLKDIISHYWKGGGFNGYTVNIESEETYQALKELILDKQVEVIFSSEGTPNPFIKAFEISDSMSVVMDKLERINRNPSRARKIGGITVSMADFCVYPSKSALSSLSLPSNYKDKPFSQLMAKGYPYFHWVSFESNYLNHFRENPEFDLYERFVCGRITGSESDFFEMDYGLSFDRKTNEKYWGIFLGNLSEFSSRMQQKLKSHEIEAECYPHPEFAQNQMGHFYDGVCLFEAVLMEIDAIYRMTEVFSEKPLFKINFLDYEKRKKVPLSFSYLERPTKACFEDFCLGFSQVVIDNINKGFFECMGIDTCNSEGERRGTLSMMKEFFRVVFRDSPEAISDMENNIKSLQNLQGLRSKGVHSTSENEINDSYTDKQNEILEEVYKSLKGIRMAFSFHPKVQEMGIKPCESIEKGEVYLNIKETSTQKAHGSPYEN